MTKTWLVSDTHFGHEKTCTVFKRPDGSPLRPFKDAEEMDRVMIERWNAVVKDEDRVYHLGDVAIGRKHLWKCQALKGRKALVRGNHDIFKTQDFINAGFEEIHGVRVLNTNEDTRVILSHIPLHPESVKRFGCNIHGHMHGLQLDDPMYYCITVENTDFAPITLEEALKRWKTKARGHA